MLLLMSLIRMLVLYSLIMVWHLWRFLGGEVRDVGPIQNIVSGGSSSSFDPIRSVSNFSVEPLAWYSMAAKIEEGWIIVKAKHSKNFPSNSLVNARNSQTLGFKGKS